VVILGGISVSGFVYLITFAEIVGQENVITGTDCGLDGRVHPQIAWAKLRALRDGAAIASKKLWS
jgi:5-methyltetrahydropteroyltriglutamate--homocysteine methyltransferase